MKQKLSSGINGRLLKGFGAQGFSQSVQIVIRMAEIPLLLSFWGPHLYGEWLMLSAITVFISICDGGFSTAACREMTIKSGAGDKKSVQVIFQSTWLLLIIISFLTGLCALIFIFLLPLHSILGFSEMNGFETKTTLFILIVNVLVIFQSGLLNGGYWVKGKHPNATFFIAVTLFLEFFGLFIAVMCGKGPIFAAFGLLFGRAVGTAIMWIGQIRVSPWLMPGFSYISLMEIKRLFIPAMASLAFPLGNALNVQGVRLVVGMVLDPTAVAIFVPMRTLSRLAIQPSIIISRLMQPELAFAYGTKSTGLFKKIFMHLSQFAIWGCLLSCFFVGPIAHLIFPLWTNGMVSIHWPTFLILLSSTFIYTIWYTAVMIPYSINQHGRVAIYYFTIFGIFSVFLCFVGASIIGFVGVAWSLMVVDVLMAVAALKITLPIVELDIFEWFTTTLRPPQKILLK